LALPAAEDRFTITLSYKVQLVEDGGGHDSMEQKPQHGYLVLADISGYTSYLAGVELDHARGVLTDLLETLVTKLKSLLTISKLEGDAVFGYVDEALVSRGETILELVEATYMGFRDRQDGIRRRTTCTCNACRAIPTLDLKFIVHHGDYMTQSIAGIHELVGSDVNLVHRLLKNHIGERTGWRAYGLFTGQSLEHLVVPCDPRELHSFREEYEHLGTVETYSFNLRKRYDELSAQRQVVVADSEADLIYDLDYPVPPAVLWDWLNDPVRRGRWMAGTAWTAEARPGGRTGVGASNHCAHGKNETSRETLLDWKPFNYLTARNGEDEKMCFTNTLWLTPSADGRGTHLRVTIKGTLGKMPRLISGAFWRVMLGKLKYRQCFDDLAKILNQDAAGSQLAQSGMATAAA
jgi:uncharacterized protein YndB with AHSA1/START domain